MVTCTDWEEKDTVYHAGVSNTVINVGDSNTITIDYIADGAKQEGQVRVVLVLLAV